MLPETPAPQFDIRIYLDILLRRKWIVVATLLIVVTAAYVQSDRQTPMYSATGEMLFTRRSTASAIDGSFNSDSGTDPQRKLATDVRLIQSADVRAVARRFYAGAGDISAQAASDADILFLTSRSADPKTTARTVNAYMLGFIEYRRVSALNDVLAAQDVLNQRIAKLQGQINELTANLNTEKSPDEDEISQRTTLLGQQDLARQQIDRLQEGVNFEDTTRILTQPQEPTAPYAPKPRKAATEAAAIGLVLGIGLAFLRDLLDDSIKTKDDLSRAAPSLSILATIPVVAMPKMEPSEVVSLTRPKSSTAEAYRSLRTSIQFMGLDRPLRVLQITSAVASEGKTTTVANLAVALASVGQRVVVVCCDLRRPRIHEMFGLSNRVGFTSVLLGEVPLGDALQPVPGVPHLFVLASGQPPPNPAELLAGARTATLFTALAEFADIVLIDCPPILPVTDSAVIANRVDATILVAGAGRTSRKHFARALETLTQIESQVVGAVLSEAPAEAASYGYGYDTKEQPELAPTPAQAPSSAKPSPGKPSPDAASAAAAAAAAAEVAANSGPPRALPTLDFNASRKDRKSRLEADG